MLTTRAYTMTAANEKNLPQKTPPKCGSTNSAATPLAAPGGRRRRGRGCREGAGWRLRSISGSEPARLACNQRCSVSGICGLGHALDPLAHRYRLDVRDTPFGHDDIDVALPRGHRAVAEIGDDAALSRGGRRCESDNGKTTV